MCGGLGGLGSSAACISRASKGIGGIQKWILVRSVHYRASIPFFGPLLPWQSLYFFPLPQGQGSLRAIFFAPKPRSFNSPPEILLGQILLNGLIIVV